MLARKTRVPRGPKAIRATLAIKKHLRRKWSTLDNSLKETLSEIIFRHIWFSCKVKYNVKTWEMPGAVVWCSYLTDHYSRDTLERNCTRQYIHTTTQELLDAMAKMLAVWNSLLIFGPLQPGYPFNPGSSAEHTLGLPHCGRGVFSVPTDTDWAVPQTAYYWIYSALGGAKNP